MLDHSRRKRRFRAVDTLETLSESLAGETPRDRHDEIANLRTIKEQYLFASNASDRVDVDPVAELIDQSMRNQLQLSPRFFWPHLPVPILGSRSVGRWNQGSAWQASSEPDGSSGFDDQEGTVGPLMRTATRPADEGMCADPPAFRGFFASDGTGGRRGTPNGRQAFAVPEDV